MSFLDLNIPYLEGDTHLSSKTAAKSNRLKLLLKSISLGYSGVAFTRTITGLMSDHHRCSIPPFPISSILKVSTGLAEAAAFRREMMGVDVKEAFRQYCRVTVVAENAAQCAALNSGNHVIKSYDLVAVRPRSQMAFDQACTASEVDLISIDFSEKLPFRLKQHMVKAAIERGIYFEIAYSALLTDVQVRRQIITSCKLLVDWTRGKNLIISSAANSVTELRGPYDVANLSSLLGLSMEHAKAALSKNCRSLLAKALKKKQYYKEAIRVEIVQSGQEFDSNEHWPKDWMKWDPISSGEGDLFLDDMAKSFSEANKVAKVVKPIDFAKVTYKLPSHGLQVHKLKPVTEANMHSTATYSSFADTESIKFGRTSLDSSEDVNPLSLEDVRKSFSVSNKVEVTVNPIDFASVTDKLPSHGLQVQDLKPIKESIIHAFETDLSFSEPTKLAKILVHPSKDRNMSHASPFQHQKSCADSVKSPSTQTQDHLISNEIDETHPAEEVDKHNNSDVFLQTQNCIRRCDAQLDQFNRNASVDSSPMDVDIICAREAVSGADPTDDMFPLSNVRTSGHSGVALGSLEDGMKPVSEEINVEVEALGSQEDGMKPVSEEINVEVEALGSQEDGMKRVSEELDVEVEPDTQLASNALNDVDNGHLKEITAVRDAIIAALPLVGVSYDEEHKNYHIATGEVSVDTVTEVKGDLSQTLCLSDKENSHLPEMKDAPVAFSDLVFHDKINGSSGHSTVVPEPSDEVEMEEQMMIEDHTQSSSPAADFDRSSSKRKRKHRMPSQAIVFPFKRILNRTPFKRKSHKAKTQSKLL